MEVLKPTRHLKRKFLPEDFQVDSWETLAPWFQKLVSRDLTSVEELEQWLEDRSELESAMQETARWRFIHTTIDTGNESYVSAFRKFVSEIKPRIAKLQHDLDQKFIKVPFIDELDQRWFYPYIRSIKSRIKLFSDNNIPLFTEEVMAQKKYEEISSRMTVELNGKELTLQQASIALNSPDRKAREKAYLKLGIRRLQDKIPLDELFSDLVKIRHQIAVNAHYKNFRDYQFAALRRFDYSPEDCHEFHDSIRKEVLPVVRFLNLRKATVLDLGALRPWDSKIASTGRSPKRPFSDTSDMLEKSIEIFRRINPEFGDYLSTMREMAYLDLDSRIGKAPGGYNCHLPESGVPFIFMNATGSTADVKTMMHEGGHAVHSFLSRDLRFNGFRDTPPEISEVASMAMEFFSYDYWDLFYPDPEDLRLARIEYLERTVNMFSWVACIDAFQHWVYTHPDHTVADRDDAWWNIHRTYSDAVTDWSDLDHFRIASWQAQLHVFKVPFYYIEYAIAKLGAIALWRNYKNDPKKTLQQYSDALKLGYTRTIGETYEAAGIRFDFSQEYVRELIGFVKKELEELYRD